MNNLPVMQETRFNPWVRKIWRREWIPTSVFFPGKPHGQKNLASFSSWGHKELDMTDIFIQIMLQSISHISLFTYASAILGRHFPKVLG